MSELRISNLLINNFGQLKVGSINVKEAYVGSILVFPKYDRYVADIYPCSTCASIGETLVDFYTGVTVTVGKYYLPETLDGNSYLVTRVPNPNEVINFLVRPLNSTPYDSCAIACGITTTTTTSTTTSTTTAAPTTTTSTTTSTTTVAPTTTTTTSTTTSTTTAAPTTTTSTTTSTTTVAPTTTTTTTSTTTSTTTAAPTTTTTTSTTTSTTTAAPTTTTTTSTTTEAPTTTTSTTTSTTTIGYVEFTLSYSAIDGITACSNYPTTDTTQYYASVGSTLTNGTIIYTSLVDGVPINPAPNGFYSNSTNYWFTSAGSGNLQSQTSCSEPTTTTTTSTTTSTTTAAPTTTTTTSTTTAAPTTTTTTSTTTTTTTCASLPYTYFLTYNYADGLPVIYGATTIYEACSVITESFAVYSNSSTFSAGAALYYDSCGTVPIIANDYTLSSLNLYNWNSNYVTFETDGYTVRSVTPCFATTTTSTTTTTTTNPDTVTIYWDVREAGSGGVILEIKDSTGTTIVNEESDGAGPKNGSVTTANTPYSITVTKSAGTEVAQWRICNDTIGIEIDHNYSVSTSQTYTLTSTPLTSTVFATYGNSNTPTDCAA